MSDACWSPAMPQIEGAPSRAVGRPDGHRSSPRSRAAVRSVCAAPPRARGPRPTVSACDQGGDGGVGGVGHVQAATPRGSRPPRCRRCRSTVRRRPSGSDRGRPRPRWRPAWWPRRWEPSGCPSAWRARQVPTVRRSCQPMPGATGRRCGGPTQWWRPAGWPPRRRPPGRRRPAPVAPFRARRCAMRSASNSTRPGAGVSGRVGGGRRSVTVASGRTMAARTPEVPTSTTRTLTARAPGRRTRPAHLARIENARSGRGLLDGLEHAKPWPRASAKKR